VIAPRRTLGCISVSGRPSEEMPRFPQIITTVCMALAVAPLTTALTASSPWTPLRSTAAPSRTVSGAPSQRCQAAPSRQVSAGKCSGLAMCGTTAASENPEATASPYTGPFGPLMSVMLTHRIMLKSFMWNSIIGVCSIYVFLKPSPGASLPMAAITKIREFITNQHTGFTACIGVYAIFQKWGVLEWFPKIFNIALKDDIDALKGDVNSRFDAVDSRFDALELQMKNTSQFDALNCRFDTLELQMKNAVSKASPAWESVLNMVWSGIFDQATFRVTQSTHAEGANTVKYDIVVIAQDDNTKFELLPETNLRCQLVHRPPWGSQKSRLVLEARTNDKAHELMRHRDVTQSIITHLPGSPSAPPSDFFLETADDFRDSGRYELSVST